MRLVQVLGPGCANCNKLAQHAEAAVEQLGLEAEVEKVTDMNQIISAGVMMTPALVIDGDVKVVGKVASVDDIKQWLADR
jgi:small redox-active disulfide protein 2